MSTATMNGAPPSLSPFAGRASKPSADYELPPAGNHPARLVMIHDLGTHDESYNGEPKPDVRKLYLAWELVEKKMKDGQPFVIGQEYSVSVDKDGGFVYTDKANIRKMMESWRGEKFAADAPVDPVAFLGKPCLVNVAHKSSGSGESAKTYANLAGISPPIEGMKVAPLSREKVLYHISMGQPPALPWFPRSFGQTLDEIVADSKERTGKPIGVKGQPKDTPHSEAIKPAVAAPVTQTDDDDIPF